MCCLSCVYYTLCRGRCQGLCCEFFDDQVLSRSARKHGEVSHHSLNAILRDTLHDGKTRERIVNGVTDVFHACIILYREVFVKGKMRKVRKPRILLVSSEQQRLSLFFMCILYQVQSHLSRGSIVFICFSYACKCLSIKNLGRGAGK